MARWAGLGAGLVLLAYAGMATAQDDDPMAEQRCVWSCLANSPGAESDQYNDCVQRLCVAPENAGGAGAETGAAVEAAPSRSLRPQLRPAPPSGADQAGAAPPAPGLAAPPMPGEAAPQAGWAWGEAAEGMFAGVEDAARGTRLDWLCGKGRPSVLALSPYRGDGGFVVTAGVRTEGYDVKVEGEVAYAGIDLASPLFAHIASGPTVSVADGSGQVLGEFPMAGAAMAIGQAEGRCR